MTAVFASDLILSEKSQNFPRSYLGQNLACSLALLGGEGADLVPIPVGFLSIIILRCGSLAASLLLRLSLAEISPKRLFQALAARFGSSAVLRFVMPLSGHDRAYTRQAAGMKMRGAKLAWAWPLWQGPRARRRD
jgi:hypothetical protein